MHQRRSERLVSKTRPLRKETASASVFFSFNVSSLLPSVDLDSFNDAHFGYLPRAVDSHPKQSREGFVKHLSADLVEQCYPVEPRKRISNPNPLVRGASALQGCLSAVKVSLSSICGRKNGKGVDEMIKAGRLDHNPGTKEAFDIPGASTSGRVDGEFWKESRRDRASLVHQPLGTLYNSSAEHGFQNNWGLLRGKTLEESVKIDQNHSVSTGFEQGKKEGERSIWLSTNHKLGVNHALATQYANDLKGGNNFNVSTSHKFVPDSTFSTNLNANSFGECSVEVELQREKKRGKQEVLESFMANLRTGDRLLRLQSRNVMKEIVFVNSIVSNLRGQHALRFMATVPFWRSGFVSSILAMDLHGSQKFSMNAVQKIHDQIMIGASFATNLKEEDFISVEAKHQLDGLGNLVLKLTNDLQCRTLLDVTTSLTTKRNSWLWTYRNARAEGHSLGLEWRREISPEHFFSIRAAAKDWICTLFTEMCLPC